MDKLKRYLPDQKFLILLNRFIMRYDESQCSKKKLLKMPIFSVWVTSLNISKITKIPI